MAKRFGIEKGGGDVFEIEKEEGDADGIRVVFNDI